MHDPIVVWPPGTFNQSCNDIGYWDCTTSFPEYAGAGYTVCCF